MKEEKKERGMNKAKLLRCYKLMHANPNKTFILRDFQLEVGGRIDRVYLETLVSLGLVEEVGVMYELSNSKQKKKKQHFHKDVKGYRLLVKTKLKREKLK